MIFLEKNTIILHRDTLKINIQSIIKISNILFKEFMIYKYIMSIFTLRYIKIIFFYIF